MKKLSYISVLFSLILISCQDGYIDDITKVDPGEDSSAPEITLLNPTGDVSIPFTQTQTDLNVGIEVSDDIELSSVTISLNGQTIESYNSFVDYRNLTQSIQIPELEIGEYQLSVKATDLSGKESETSLDFMVTNQYIPQEGEIFYMPFEEGSFEDLVSETMATTNGNIGSVQGVFGNAAEFSVEDTTYALFTPTPEISNLSSFTLSFWSYVDFVDSDESGGIDGVIGLVNFSNVGRFWGNIDFFIENGSNPTDGADMRLHITNGTSETWITNVNDQTSVFNKWSQHVLTYDDASKTFNYYLNGNLATTAAASWDTGLDFQDLGPMVMGCVQFQTKPSLTSATSSQPWASYLTGELDEVKIYNRALTAEQVNNSFNSNNPQ